MRVRLPRDDDGGAVVGFLVGVAAAVGLLVLVPGLRDRLPGEVDLAGTTSAFAAGDLPQLFKDVYDGVARFEVQSCDEAWTGSGALVEPDLV